MKLIIEIPDDQMARIAPCEKNGEHKHDDCIVAFVEHVLQERTAQVEFGKVQERFKNDYQRPQLSVTTE